MAMAVENRQQPPMGISQYESMRYPPAAAPHFTNPWVSAPAAAPQMYPTSSAMETSAPRPAAVSMPQYPALAGTAPPPLGSGIPLSDGLYEAPSSLEFAQGLLDSSRSYAGSYTSASSPSASAYAPTSAPQYTADPYRSTPYGYQADAARRGSHPLSNPSSRSSFSEAIDSARGMVAMSQGDMTTPRNIYGSNPRNSTDSYGFPTAHSSHSSISSASTYPSYYNGSAAGSVDGSVTDYSSASESVSDMGSRTLPRPSALVGTSLPPAPQSMMGQFSSKVSSSSQKKHKCKICDKRFTRPSSLQTHMYSHTGEKPFACEVEGCGRHFSVVSNLRRHRKVHKGEGQDHPSPDDM